MDLDYIEIAIDRQQSCHWPDTSFLSPTKQELTYLGIFKKKLYAEKCCLWGRCKSSPHQSIPLPKRVGLQNSVVTEDMMIAAIDAQYSRIFKSNYRMLEYLTMGYTQKEIGKFFGYSQSKVHRIVKKLKGK